MVLVERYLKFLPFIFFLAGIFFLPSDVFAANKYWIGSAGGNFSDNANWSTSSGGANDTTAPTSSDVAIFDSGNTNNATVDASFGGSILGLQMNSGYTGTITLARNLTIGTSDFTQAAGTIDLSSYTFTLNTADFTKTGGTFTAGTGTVFFDGNASTFNIDTSLTLYNVTFDTSNTSQPVTISSGDTMVVTGTLFFSFGAVNGPGSIEMQGSTTTVGSSGTTGTVLVKYLENGDQTISASGGYIPGLLVNKSSGTVTQVGDLDVFTADFTLQSGTYEVGSNTLSLVTSDFTISGGTFDASGSTIVFDGNAATVDINTSLTLNNVTFDSSNSSQAITISSGDTLIVTGTLTFSFGLANGPGSIEMQGSNTVIGSTGTVGTLVVKYLEAGDQTITGSGGYIPGLLINKPSGTISQSGNVNVSTGDYEMQSGTYALGSNTLTLTTSDFTISGGTFNSGTGTVVFGGNDSTFDVNSSLTLYNATFAKVSTAQELVIATGDTMVVTGTLTLTTGGLNGPGSVEMQGLNTVVGSTGTIGTGVVQYLVAGDQTITGSGGYMPGILINKPSGSVTQSGDVDIYSADFEMQSGEYVIGANTLTLVAADFTISGGTFTTTGSTIVISGNSSSVDIDTSVTLNNLTVAKTNSSQVLTLASGDNIVVDGNFILNQYGKINGPGTLEIRGTTTTMTGFTGGDVEITFAGNRDQTYQLVSGEEPDGDVVINKTGGSLTLLSNFDLDATGQALTITQGTLKLDGFNLTVTDALTLGASGILELYGNETVTAGSKSFNSGSTVRFTGDGDAGSDSYTLSTLATSYGNLVVNSTDGATDSFAISASPFTVAGDFTLTAGTVTGGTATINVAGDWSNSGTFTAGTSTVVLNGTSQSVNGSTTFYNFTKNVTSADTLTFENGSTQTVTNTWNVQGATGELLSLRSDLNGTQWKIDPQSTRTIGYIDVKDSNNINATVVSVAGFNVTNSGNNTNWAFMEVTSVTGQNPQTTAGGKSILVNGLYFVDTPTVSIGGSAATVTNFTTTQLTITAPAKSAGTYDVVVTNPDSSASTCSTCMEYVAPPTVTSIDYTYASTAGSQSRVITGSGMKVGAGGIVIDPSGTADSATTTGTNLETTFTTPAHTAGSVVVRVYGDGGTDDNGIYTDTASGFIVFEAPPTFSSIDEAYAPTVGSGARSITGTNMKVGASGAKVGATTVTTNGTATTVTFTPPDTTAGAVTIRLYSTNGTDGNGLYVDASNALTYEAKPTVSSVSPSTDLVTTGGDTVTIGGSGIKVGATGAIVDPSGTADVVTTSGTSSSATFTTPAHTAGTVVLRVYSTNGTDDNGIYTDYSSITFAVASTSSSEESSSGGVMLPPPPEIIADLQRAFSCGQKNYLNLILTSSQPFKARLTEAGVSEFTPWTVYAKEVEVNVLVSSGLGQKSIVLHRVGNFNTILTQFFDYDITNFGACEIQQVSLSPTEQSNNYIYHIVPDRTQRIVEQEIMALKLYAHLFKSLPNNGDAWRLHNYLAYGGQINKRSLEKESRGLIRFIAQEKRLPKSSLDWRIVAVLGYGIE